jgi:hypothetical protein
MKEKQCTQHGLVNRPSEFLPFLVAFMMGSFTSFALVVIADHWMSEATKMQEAQIE